MLNLGVVDSVRMRQLGHLVLDVDVILHEALEGGGEGGSLDSELHIVRFCTWSVVILVGDLLVELTNGISSNALIDSRTLGACLVLVSRNAWLCSLQLICKVVVLAQAHRAVIPVTRVEL